ncbi:MAG: hypothetical protein WCP28_02740 [Actinomycetes bacterium]
MTANVPVRMLVHNEGTTWWAEAEEVPGYSVAADSYGELNLPIKDGIKFALGLGDDADVIVVEEFDAEWPVVLFSRSDWTVPQLLSQGSESLTSGGEPIVAATNPDLKVSAKCEQR